MTEGLGPIPASLIDRAKAIVLKPNDEWPKIATETQSQGDILRSYVLPLAAIGPIAGLIGSQVFGYGALFVSIRPSLMSSLTSAVLSFVLTIVGVFVLAAIADWLAPKFEGQSNKLNAFKLVAYGGTAAWLAGIFSLVPMLAVFGLLGLYSLYLFYTGSGPMMAIPEAKRVAYTAVTFLAAAVLYWIVALIVGMIVAAIGFGAAGIGAIAGASADDDEVTISIPGVGSVNSSKIEEAAARAEKIQKGEIKPVPTDTLKAMLPDSIGSFSRTGFSTMAMGVAGSGVEGDYKAGDQQFSLKVQDMLALSGIAGIGSAMGIEQEKEDENGYERIGTVDGQWREERWRKNSNSGTYAVMIADRFRVEASGNVENIDVLKGAVASINEGDLKNLAE
ncbi:MAG: YIP1 family protein [Novosphingobium sp.]|nr:YIP1 family protein [Novosphingobium sp.]